MADAGRPPLYETPELMQQAIDLYFKTCEAEKKMPIITRLAYELGFASRQSFYDYEEKPEFTYVIKRARLFIESGYEASLQGNNCTGMIFALKNMGWKDKTESEHYGKDGKPIETSTTIKIIRDTSTGIAPGEFTPESKTGTSAE